MKKIFLTLLLFSSIFAQANRLLTLVPTAHASSIGNVSLPMMNPARNHIMKDRFTFGKVNWLGNIVSDMNYLHGNLEKGAWDASVLIFNYGQQLETDINGVVTGEFSPMSSVWSAGWGGLVKGYNVGFTAKFISHDLYVQRTFGTAFDVATYLPKIYKDLDIDVALRNFGFAPKFGDTETMLPTSLNVGMTYPYKEWTFYEQHNFFKKFHTFGSGVSYNYNNMIWGKAGYYWDKHHDLSYPTFGMDLKYDRYFIGFSYIYGDETLPVSNTFRLTINLEL